MCGGAGPGLGWGRAVSHPTDVETGVRSIGRSGEGGGERRPGPVGSNAKKKKKREKVESGHWVVCRESTLSHFVFLLPLGKKLEEDQMYFLGLWTPAVSWVMLTFTVAVIGGASSEENDFVASSKISEAIGLFL